MIHYENFAQLYYCHIFNYKAMNATTEGPTPVGCLPCDHHVVPLTIPPSKASRIWLTVQKSTHVCICARRGGTDFIFRVN